MKDLVSVLVPVYGVEQFVGRCSISLFEQDYENLEYIFVDDCSPDNSIDVILKILEEYPQRKSQVHIIKHQENRGLAETRNTAVAHARGEYLIHVDSDDFIDKETISEVMKQLISAGADAAIFGMKHIYADKVVESFDMLPRKSDSVETYVNRLIRREQAAYVCGSIYKTKLYKEHGIQAIRGINVGEDYATKPRLLYHAKNVIGIPKAYYNYVHYNANSYSKNFSNKNIENFKLALDVLSNFFSDKGATYNKSLLIAESRLEAELLISWGVYGGSKNDLKLIKKVFNSNNNSVFSSPVQYKLVYLLSSNGFLLKSYCWVGMGIKHWIKK